MNLTILSGRITRDIETKYTQSQLAIASFTLAVDREVKKEGSPTADFINCVSFGKTAETMAKYLSKGSKIIVTGRIQTRNYENKEGVKVYVTEIMVDRFEFCDSKKSEQSQSEFTGFEQVDDISESLPF